MKILYVTDSFAPESVGGAGQVVLDMAKGMIAKGNEVVVLTATTRRENAGESVYEGIPVCRIFSSQKSQFLRSYLAVHNPFIRGKFMRAIREIGADAIHFHNVHEHFSFAALRWARKVGGSVFITLHDTLSFYYTRVYHFIDSSPFQKGPFDYRIPFKFALLQTGKSYNPFRNVSIRRSLRAAHVVFSVSDALKDALEQNGIPGAVTLYNGINIQEFISTSEEIADLRSRLGLSDRPVILFGGRAMMDKGPEILIRILPKILVQHPRACAVMAIGKGKYPDRLQALAQNLNIESSVKFIDLVQGREKAALFSAASVVIVPSIYLDPAPLMVMQAMAAGKPVIGTCFGGTPEIMLDNVTGYVVNPFDENMLVKRLSYLLANPAHAQAMGEAARERITKHFSLDRQLDLTLDFYKKSLLPIR